MTPNQETDHLNKDKVEHRLARLDLGVLMVARNPPTCHPEMNGDCGRQSKGQVRHALLLPDSTQRWFSLLVDS